MRETVLNLLYEEGVLPFFRAVGHDARGVRCVAPRPRRARRAGGGVARERKLVQMRIHPAMLKIQHAVNQAAAIFDNLTNASKCSSVARFQITNHIALVEL